MGENKQVNKTPVKKIIFITIALFIVLFFRFLPAPKGLSVSGMHVIGTFLGVLLLWITIGIDWPSLMCLASLSFIPSLGIDTVLKSSFGNSTFAFLLFTFMCTYAISKTGFIRRIALAFVTSKLAKKGPWQLAISFLAAVVIIGCFMSPTVLYFVMLPILEEIYSVLALKKGDKFASMLAMGLVFCTSLSAGMTPIAHVFPVLAMGVYQSAVKTTISYANYMAFAIPTGIILFVLLMLVFRFILNPPVKEFESMDQSKFEALKKEIPESDIREKLIFVIFAFVVILWVVPGIIKPALPEVAAFINKYGTAMPPLLGVVVMSIIRIEGKPLLNFNEAMTKGVSWPSLIMAASTLAIGSAMTDKKIGLTTFLTSSIKPVTHNMPVLLLIILFVTWAAIESNLSSHMVTAQLVATIAVPVALASTGFNAQAIACVIGMVASFGSATPPSMPYVAVAGASGWTDAMELIKYGFTMMFVVIIIAVTFSYPIASLLMR
ncbi:MAG TPA: sodium:sulfate symporter [Clostridiaceae bacterium]|nr:sodium:sulfate symporter [Clostridiaceae bacterium]